MDNIRNSGYDVPKMFRPIATDIRAKFWPKAKIFAGNMPSSCYDRLFRVGDLTMEVTRVGLIYYLKVMDVNDDNTRVCLAFDKPTNWSKAPKHFAIYYLEGDQSKCLEIARKLAEVVDQMKQVDFGDPDRYL